MARLALLSVSDKTGIVDLARSLVERYGFQLVSSGGTAKALQAAGIAVTKVSEHTGAPEILGGRVKTLHPRIHGGILGRPTLDSDRADLEAQSIPPIELVACNLYPFEQTVAEPETTLTEAIEQIDIGGPTLVRAAAKNFDRVTILTDPSQYEPYLAELETHGSPSLDFRFSCARAAFDRVLSYDCAISAYLAGQSVGETPAREPPLLIRAIPHQTLRYGENPQQQALWYREMGELTGWAGAQKLQGKDLSYNNLVDLEAARAIAAEFADDPQVCVAILKHTNPCGMALADTVEEAYRSALAGDPVSAFGGIVAITRPLDAPTARALTETFLECVIAPACGAEAAEILQAKQNLRLLVLPNFQAGPQQTVKAIAGGYLVQQADSTPTNPDSWTIPTEVQPTAAQLRDLTFAWKVCKFVKSNAIVVAKDGRTLGIGAGQMNRVGAAKIALEQAGDRAQGAVLASDGFFPFGDSVTHAAAAGIAAVIQPGGSIRDRESIDAANVAGIPMICTGIRHFLH
ncbi:bifunctional phosphoribosylaminoimidazolecarboxamide formyltransferase/IMP cyclohydrolase [Synechococcus sp. PCC 7336]|uniref:bifunctional phosphoribosylaminoimidazolecarboxamide formyltransferase/IMP cyclohydrolase n=1 Tax=Synechococcus sp. PCC 7336 TaxID=195250 RepID=UPI00034C29E1|nr:bifunctional phosphoribosylaminoimidazolecarboxamide formyltransferase/IMP cyclohydrolase [Synechococcus sp. PCC 7336]